MNEQLLDELIQMDTWDWWKSQLFVLREQSEYAEAEALFLPRPEQSLIRCYLERFNGAS